MGALDALVHVLVGKKTFELSVVSWRQSLDGVSPIASQRCMDDHRVELKCRLHKSLLDDYISVGANPSESQPLEKIDFTIEICSVQRVLRQFEEGEPELGEGQDTVGLLMYHRPLTEASLAGLPSSAIEKSTSASVSGWLLFGDRSVHEISRLLTLRPRLEMDLLITVAANATSQPLSLTYETKVNHPTKYRWDAAENPLKIIDARVLVTEANP